MQNTTLSTLLFGAKTQISTPSSIAVEPNKESENGSSGSFLAAMHTVTQAAPMKPEALVVPHNETMLPISEGENSLLLVPDVSESLAEFSLLGGVQNEHAQETPLISTPTLHAALGDRSVSSALEGASVDASDDIPVLNDSLALADNQQQPTELALLLAQGATHPEQTQAKQQSETPMVFPLPEAQVVLSTRLIPESEIKVSPSHPVAVVSFLGESASKPELIQSTHLTVAPLIDENTSANLTSAAAMGMALSNAKSHTIKSTSGEAGLLRPMANNVVVDAEQSSLPLKSTTTLMPAPTSGLSAAEQSPQGMILSKEGDPVTTGAALNLSTNNRSNGILAELNMEFVGDAEETPFDMNEQRADFKGTASLSSLGQNAVATLELRHPGQRLHMPVDVHFSHQQWSSAVAEKAAQLVSQRVSTAELQLDPPELGPIQVRVQVNQEQVAVNFVVSNSQVREALDQSILKLRDMLQEQGLELVDSGVSDQQKQQQNAEEAPDEYNSMGSGRPSDDDALIGGDESSKQGEIVISWGVDHYV